MISVWLRRLPELLGRDVSPYALAFFRIWLGLLVAWEALILLSSGKLTSMFIEPAMLFPYYGLEWVRPLPGNGIYLHFLFILVSALGLAAGFAYRLSAAVLLITWTWFWLLDQSYYQNHVYLISLLAGMFLFMPGHAVLALDNVFLPKTRLLAVPAWTVYLLRAQLGIVYLYAGFAKLTPDWLQGQPMGGLVHNSFQGMPLLGSEAAMTAAAWLLSYGGLVFDLTVFPALLWSRTRPYAFAAAVVFHLTNSQLFHIDIFPWLAIGATTIFFAPGWPLLVAARFGWVKVKESKTRGESQGRRVGRMTLAVLAIYLAIQCLLPFRHFLYPGHHNWTEEGQRLSWFLMARAKMGRAAFFARDPGSNQTWRIDPEHYLNARQVANVATHPDMIWQFAQFVVAHMARQGYPGVEVRAYTQCRLNNRDPALLVDPDRNLAAEPRRLFSHYDWIMPHPGPLKPHAHGEDALDLGESPPE